MTNPIYDYVHSGGCAAITGGAFIPNGAWPAAYDNAYFFADYVCGSIFQLTEQVDGSFKRTPFATGLGNSSAVAMIFGPAGSGTALYYTVTRMAARSGGSPAPVTARRTRSQPARRFPARRR